MKYIMFDTKDGRKLPVIFADDLVHADVALVMARAGRELGLFPSTAGFVTMGVVATFGESETLKMKSNPKDATTINVYDYEKGRETPMTEHLGMMTQLKTAELLITKIDPNE